MSDTRTYAQLWSEAEARFKKRTSKSLRQGSSRTLADVINDLGTQFDKDEPTKGVAKKQELLRKVDNVLTCIKLLGGVAATATAQVFGEADICFNAVVFLLDIPGRIKGLYDGLETLFTEISNFLQEFKIYRRVESYMQGDSELRGAVNEVLICFVDICALSIEILDSTKMTKFKAIAKKALFNDDSGVSAELERFKTLINHQGRIADAVTLEHVLQSQHSNNDSAKELFEYLKTASESADKKLDSISASIAKVQALVDEQKETASEAQMQGLLDWLSKADSSVAYNEAFNKHLEGTGEWFTESSDFHEWHKGSTNCLLLHGIMGSGKTVLCASAIREIRASLNESTTSQLCYFFFKRQSRQGPDDMLKSIIRNVCNPSSKGLRDQYHASLRKTFYGKYLSGETPNSDDIINFLSHIEERIYIIIDALDECGKVQAGKGLIEARRSVVKLMSQLCGISNVRILVSCRDGPFSEEITRALDGLKRKSTFEFTQIAMEHSSVNEDIERLIEQRFDENLRDFLEQYPEWDEKIRQRIKADGMFLLVASQLDLLEDMINESREWGDIERSLKQLPDDINGVYSLMLNGISTEKQPMAVTALKCIVCAQRPLRVFELQELISEVYHRPFNLGETFSNLVVKRRSLSSKDNFVEFAHDTSIREFLYSENSGNFHMEIFEAHHSFAETCVAYLKNSKLEIFQGISHDDCPNCPRKRRALEYAINNWHSHAIVGSIRKQPTHRSSPDKAESDEATKNSASLMAHERILGLLFQILALLIPLLQMTRNRPNNNAKNPPKTLDEQSPRSPTGKTLVAWSEAAKITLDRIGTDTEWSDELQFATFTGYMVITGILLSHGASVEITKEGFNPLMAAAGQNYPNMIRLLLNTETEEISRKTNQSYPFDVENSLSSTNETIATAIVQTLLQYKADPEATNTYHQTALHLAAGSNQKQVVELLLERVKDRSIRDYSGATALHWAAAGGYPQIVKILIERGVNINAQSAYRKRPSLSQRKSSNAQSPRPDYQLIRVAELGNQEDIKSLLDSGASPTAFDQYGSTALHWVCCRGFEEMAATMIEKGADVNATRSFDKFGKTPLLEATRNAHSDGLPMIKTLLQSGADATVEDSTWFDHRTPLHEVAMKGSEPMVQLLLEYGADSNARDLKGQTAADLARAAGHEKIAELLNRNNRGIDARGGNGETALHMAAENNHYNAVEEILKYNADVNVRSNNGRTAIHSAAGSASTQLFNLLLDNGADILVVADNDWSVLHETCDKGNKPILDLLIAHPAKLDLNQRDSNGSTPLAVAAKSGQKHIFSTLLAHPEVDVNMVDWRGYTPLQHLGESGDVEMIELLLSRDDAEIDTQEMHYDRTPLLHAAREGHLEAVKVLLEKGADPKILDRFQWSPLAYAESNGHKAVVEALLKEGAKRYDTA